MSERDYGCGLGPAFEVVGGKWKAAILWELRTGPLRFGELRRRVPGATEKMLIQQLRELERHAVVTREVFHQVPPRVEYGLSHSGRTLNTALADLADWGETFARSTGRYPVSAA